MQIKLKEQLAPRYIYVNPENNCVHLLTPIVGGIEIATDNTCKSLLALKEFFGKYATDKLNEHSARNALNRYKKSLEHDIALLPDQHALKAAKQERLVQVNQYISALSAIEVVPEIDGLRMPKPEYPNTFKKLIEAKSNLYSILLRPYGLNPTTRSIKPVFSVQREGEQIFYNELLTAFNTFQNAHIKSEDLLLQTVLSKLNGKAVNFDLICQTTSQEVQDLFGLEVDLRVTSDGIPATQDYINAQMGIDASATNEEYVRAILGYCAADLWKKIDQSPFNKINSNHAGKEKLLMLTQFFLAQINIYCISKNISTINFGEKLENSKPLSQQVATAVKEALAAGKSVEAALFTLIQNNQDTFELNRTLTDDDMSSINSQFISRQKTMSEHTFPDEVTILDTSISGQFVTHQASICIDFSKLIHTKFTAQENTYFQRIHADSAALSGILSNNNEWTQAHLDIPTEQVMSYLTNLIQTNHFDYAVEIILDHDKELAEYPPADLDNIMKAKDKNGQTILHYLIKERRESLSTVLNLLSEPKQCVAIREKNKMGNTALMSAMLYPDILKTLLQPLSEPNQFLLLQEKNTRGDTALHLAINKPDSLKAMLASLTFEHRIQLLKVKNGSGESVQQLLERNKDSMHIVSELLLDITQIKLDSPTIDTHVSASPISVTWTATNDLLPITPPKKYTVTPSKYKLHLNDSVDALLQMKKHDCFVWNSQQKNLFSYISPKGEVNTVEMSIVKQFGFKTLLQKYAKTQQETLESSCTLRLSREEIEQLTKSTGQTLAQLYQPASDVISSDTDIASDLSQ